MQNVRANVKGGGNMDHQFILDWIEDNKDNLTYWISMKNGKLVSVDMSLPEPEEVVENGEPS